MATDEPAEKKFWSTPRLFVMLVFLVAAAIYWRWGDTLSLAGLSGHESALRRYGVDHPVLVCLVALSVYIAITGLSLPGATALTLVVGWYFGFGRGLVLVSFASTTGATIAFLTSRYFLREAVRSKFGARLASFNDNLRREGAFYLFTLRLIPAIPFFAINLVMGLTPISTRTFWWVSQIGMLPGTAIYVYAGSTFPTLRALAENGVGGILTPQLFAALFALGLFPLVAKWSIGRFRRASEDSPAE